MPDKDSILREEMRLGSECGLVDQPISPLVSTAISNPQPW